MAVRPRNGGRKTGDGELEDLLKEQVRNAPARADLTATVALITGEDTGWTIGTSPEGIHISKGVPNQATVRVFADAETIAAVIGGRRSGIEAFLAGDLRVRGNLAVALQLDSMFGNGDRPVEWPRAGRTTADGLRTVYLEAGAGPPVVLLHGLGATNASFLPTLWELARDHRVVAPDLPGHGDTAKPVRAYHAAFFARWLRAFLDALGIEKAHMVGNSMGGRVAIELALRHPRRVDRVALLMPSPAFIRNREWVRLVRILRPELALLPVPVSHRQVVRAIRSMFSQPSRLPHAWYEAAADEFIRVFSTPRGRIAFFSSARQIYLEEPHGDDGFWDRLPALSRPAMFVWGERDRLVPARFARHVEAALPRSTSVVLDDCGHVPQYEMPERTHALVRDFLESRVE
jgi:pimeloyl-ACP methyl ester carboxylesterase/putative sterol carrier protein